MENNFKIKAKIGEVFKLGKYELIRLGNEQGGVAVLCKDILFKSRFGNNNVFSQSEIFRRLNAEILPEMEALVGAENVLEFTTDLLSVDGSEKHGAFRSKISLPTFDFYRANRAILEQHKPDGWWWLATPWETSEYTDDDWIACVSPRGDFSHDDVNFGNLGVRPFLVFSSSIFESCEN